MGFSWLRRCPSVNQSSITQKPLQILHHCLPAMESLMKCLEMSWMAILVGSRGKRVVYFFSNRCQRRFNVGSTGIHGTVTFVVFAVYLKCLPNLLKLWLKSTPSDLSFSQRMSHLPAGWILDYIQEWTPKIDVNLVQCGSLWVWTAFDKVVLHKGKFVSWNVTAVWEPVNW